MRRGLGTGSGPQELAREEDKAAAGAALAGITPEPQFPLRKSSHRS